MTTIYGFKTIEEAEFYTLKNHNKGEYKIEQTCNGIFKLVKEDEECEK